MKRGIALLLVTFSLLHLNNVYATAPYYINNNGVEMTESEYAKMREFYSENVVAQLTQEKFDELVCLELIDSGTLYQKTSYINGEVVNDEYISASEYYNAHIDNYSRASMAIETTYKKLTVSLATATNRDVMLADLTWKYLPVTRSYDVFAFMVSHFDYSSVGGSQFYNKGSNQYQISYDYTSPGYKGLSNGAGISMNLVDGADVTGYDLCLGATLHVNTTEYTQAHVFVTYQHAQSNTTRANSMAYTLNISGLGRVLYYSNTSIRNIYDGMNGIELSRSIP